LFFVPHRPALKCAIPKPMPDFPGFVEGDFEHECAGNEKCCLYEKPKGKGPFASTHRTIKCVSDADKECAKMLSDESQKSLVCKKVKEGKKYFYKCMCHTDNCNYCKDHLNVDGSGEKELCSNKEVAVGECKKSCDDAEKRDDDAAAKAKADAEAAKAEKDRKEKKEKEKNGKTSSTPSSPVSRSSGSTSGDARDTTSPSGGDADNNNDGNSRGKSGENPREGGSTDVHPSLLQALAAVVSSLALCKNIAI